MSVISFVSAVSATMMTSSAMSAELAKRHVGSFFDGMCSEE
jgi:hypothetical protein